MRWPPWRRRKEVPVWTPDPATTTADETPSSDLTRARVAAQKAEHSLRRARAQRPQVVAAGKALERTMSRNHLAELVRGALGSGS